MDTPLREDRLIAVAIGHVRRRRMEPWGLHGLAHWWRVRHNGLLLAPRSGADTTVVRLFSIFHDAFREDDGADPQHGPRAARWLSEVRRGRAPAADPACEDTERTLAALADDQFELLRAACDLHTASRFHADPTVATCFAADRLDLGRVGYEPNPAYIPLDRAIVSDETIREAMRRTELGLAWTDAGDFESRWCALPGHLRDGRVG